MQEIVAALAPDEQYVHRVFPIDVDDRHKSLQYTATTKVRKERRQAIKRIHHSTLVIFWKRLW